MQRTILIRGLLCFLFLSQSFFTFADEGMWLVQLMASTNYQAMKAKGVRLTAEEIYSETTPSIKDAIVALDYGSCTGSLISQKGLMITNHHCAYDDIQKLSSVEHDYLKNGFWAKNQAEELVIPGKVVLFLDRVIDITDEYKGELAKFNANSETPAISTRRLNSVFEKKYAKKGCETSCSVMMRGNQYFIYYYRVFKDVRLVAAPPTCFGAFGKDTDNWSWPQHKGDFSIYRIYGDKNGNPAEYSKDNVPVKPRYVLSVSLNGVNEGDYAMVLGYPYATARYLPSWGVYEKSELVDPALIKVRDTKLAILREAMQSSEKLNIQYASKYFSSSNYWKYAIGENLYTVRYDVKGIKAAEEAKLDAWIKADPKRQVKYGNLLKDLRETYDVIAPYMATDIYHKEAFVNGADIMRFAMRCKGCESAMRKENCRKMPCNCPNAKNLRSFCNTYFKDYDEATDRKVFAAMFQLYVENIHPDFLPKEATELVAKFNGDYKKLTDYLYDNSFMADELRAKELLGRDFDMKLMEKDPICRLSRAAQDMNYAWRDRFKDSEKKNASLRSLYTKALLEMNGDKVLPPDANSTMRITYGTVGGYSPKDAVSYSFHSSIDGYLEKYIKNDPEFDLNPDCLAAIKKADWGRYAASDGRLYTGFATNLDIIGGNSGSPVLNAKGELIGLAYDGNWESMSGDLYFHPEYNKCICVDIRFVLWIIDKYAGASDLLDEIKIVS